MNMELLNVNFLDTTTMVTVDSGTSTVDELFDRRSTLQYQSSGYAGDSTYTAIKITFPSSKDVDRIILQNHNLKRFEVYYNTIDAAFYVPLTGADTTSAVWTGNSATDLYLCCSLSSIDSIIIYARDSIVPLQEKKIGELWITESQLELEDNPNAKQYKPKYERREYTHRMSDGGVSQYIIDKTFSADIKLTFQSETMRDDLLTIYDDTDPVVFVPFPTTTGWNGKEIYEMNWVGDFEFVQPAGENYNTLGWNGTLRLRETPK